MEWIHQTSFISYASSQPTSSSTSIRNEIAVVNIQNGESVVMVIVVSFNVDMWVCCRRCDLSEETRHARRCSLHCYWHHQGLSSQVSESNFSLLKQNNNSNCNTVKYNKQACNWLLPLSNPLPLSLVTWVHFFSLTFSPMWSSLLTLLLLLRTLYQPAHIVLTNLAQLYAWTYQPVLPMGY